MTRDDDRVPGADAPSGDDELTVSSGDLGSAREASTIDGPGAAATAGSAARRPESIAGYRILGVLGEGGMGTVWEAEQEQPRRRVALKVIRRDHLVDELHRRLFHREAEVLARLKHPNIATIYASGHTDDGHDFFAMELAQGVTLDRWIAGRPSPLDARELELRLALFRTVCDAVSYANQRGVIHRDLKPSNIIVADELATSPGGSVAGAGIPVVKILDFGLARITDAEVAATTVSEVGIIKGTLQYMSPEQARGEVDAIDVRTDVYALGVILYELLTGARPYEVRRAALAEAVRVICEDPPKPLAESWNGAVRLDDDLATIVGKALEKDADRRYGSAAALSEDVERYLESQPILARPPSAAYQLRKMIQRNRLASGFAAAMLILVVAFGVTAAVQANAIARQRDLAEAEAGKAGAMNTFLRDMLTSTDPWSGGDHDITVVEALDAALGRIDDAFPDQPLVEAQMRAVLGSTYLGLRRIEPAKEQTDKALEMKIALLGSDHPEVAEVWGGRAMLARSSGDFGLAVEASREAVRIRRLHADESPVELIDALEGLARSLEHARRFDELGSVLDECDAIIGDLVGDQRRARAEILMLRADYLAGGQEDHPGAVALLREAIEILDAVDQGSADLQIATNNQATYLLAQGKLDEAGEVYTQALAGLEELVGTDHPEYAIALENLANIDFRQKRYDESMDKLERVREIRARNLGADHVDVLRTTLNIASVANGSGQHERALAIQDELLPRLREIRGDHPETALVMRNRADTLVKLGRLPEAEAAVRDSLAVYLRVHDADHLQVARTRADLGAILADQRRWAEAEAELAQALPIIRATYGDDNERTRKVLERSAEVADARGRPADASAYRAILAGGADPGR